MALLAIDSSLDTSNVTLDDVSSSTSSTPASKEEWVISVPASDPGTEQTLLGVSKSIEEAVKNGDIEFIQAFLKNDSSFSIDSVVSDGKTVLHHACVNGHLEVVKYVVKELHADVNVSTIDGKGALHFACKHGHTEVVQFLLEQDSVCPEAEQNNKWTALHIACDKGLHF
jgi:ankyrin repeat protein